MRVLIAHSSIHGSSAEIANFMAQELQTFQIQATIQHVSDVETLEPYQAVFLGGPIHTGVWTLPMFRFMKTHRAALEQKPLFAWITCVRVLEPDGFHHVLANYVPQDLHEFPLLQNIGIFAGKIDPNEITDKERWTLYLRYDGAEVMSRLKGDFREWSKIRSWTHHAAHTLHNLPKTD